MYLPYFKREFDKKRGNCGVLARFVLFLAGIAGVVFFAPSIASLFHGAAINEEFLEISRKTNDTELIDAFTKLKRNNFLYALFGAGMTVLALILAFGTLEKYMVAILLGYFLIPTIIYFFSVSEYKLNTTNTALETIRNSKTGKATREDIINLIEEETQFCDSGISDLPTHIKKMAEITKLLSDGQFLFSAEEKAQYEQFRYARNSHKLSGIYKRRYNSGYCQ